jgi:hypothetical protein
MSTPSPFPQCARDVIPFPSAQSSTPHITRSQQKLLSEPLHAGNLKAYLDGISLVDVQAILSRHFLQHQQDRSIFSFLVEPGDGVLPYEAASAVLEELASKTEDVAVLATLAYRLIEAKRLWEGHPDPSVKSAEDLIRKLDSGCDVAQANIVIGASALRQRQNYVRLIDEVWRPGWFEAIPQAIRAPSWTRPEDLPRDVLVQITANAKQGIPMADAVARWVEHINRRTDHGTRRREHIRGPTVPHLILSDIKPLNTPIKDSDKGRRTSDMFFPEDAPADGLEVKLATLKSPSKSRPDYSAAAPVSARKRKRDGPGMVEQSNADGDVGAVREEWYRGKDGMMVKRFKNQLIRRLPTSDELAALDSSPQLTQSSVGSTGGHDGTSSRHTSALSDDSTCDGPGIALVFGKFVDLYQELRSANTDTARMTARCCDSCRVFVLRALGSLEADLVPCVHGLERVEQHLYDGSEVRPNQDHGVSPRKVTPAGKRVPRVHVVPDSSDGSDVD